MGATQDFSKPNWNNPMDTDFDATRDNYNFLLAVASAAIDSIGTTGRPSAILPGWDTEVDISSNNNYAEPDSFILTRGTRAIHIRLVWVASAISTVQICYDDGVSSPGLVCFDPESVTNEEGFVVGAKHLDSASGNYYSTTQYNGLIPAAHSSDTYRFLALVFCVKPHEYADAAIFSDVGGYFRVGMIDSDGGFFVTVRAADTGGFNVLSLPASGSPTDGGPLIKDQWNSVWIHLYHDTTSPEVSEITVWINGVEKHSGPFTTISGTPPWDPMVKSTAGGYAGMGDNSVSPVYPGLDCDISFVWCADNNLPPEGDSPANYYYFFDTNHKPRDIGLDGSLVLGAPPESYFPHGDFTDNKGSGPNWTEVGTVADATTSPTD